MISIPDLAEDLRNHHTVCLEIFDVVKREGESLRAGKASSQFEFYQARKTLFTRLNDSLERLRARRAEWVRSSAEERASATAVPALLRQNQDLIMKVIVLDRENEQLLLRQGLAPVSQLPSPNRQRPHYVAELYRRGGT